MRSFRGYGASPLIADMVDRELQVTSDDEDRVLIIDGRPYATVTDVCKVPNDDRD